MILHYFELLRAQHHVCELILRFLHWIGEVRANEHLVSCIVERLVPLNLYILCRKRKYSERYTVPSHFNARQTQLLNLN